MAQISSQEVKKLRDHTGAGMMDCKKALSEAGGDFEEAVTNLRKSGIAKAEKKSGRATTEGLVYALTEGKIGTLTEVLCESDFVAKNEKFRDFVSDLAEKVISKTTGDGDVTESINSSEKTTLTDIIAVLGENMFIRRAVRWETEGTLASYMHMGGKISVLIDTEGESDPDLLKDICMHVAAFRPQFISPDDIPEDKLTQEKEIARAQVADKPDHIKEKIVQGKLQKWFSEVCLMKQPWLRDDKSCLEKVAPQITVRRYLRWEAGEDIT